MEIFCKSFFKRRDKITDYGRTLHFREFRYCFVALFTHCAKINVLETYVQTRSTTPSTCYVTAAHVHAARAGVYA